MRCIQAACADVGTDVPSDRDASYVIGLGLADALQHAAPGCRGSATASSPSATATTTSRASDEVVLFDGTIDDAAGAEGRATTGSAWPPARRARGLDEALRSSPLAGLFDAHPHRRRDRAASPTR